MKTLWLVGLSFSVAALGCGSSDSGGSGGHAGQAGSSGTGGGAGGGNKVSVTGTVSEYQVSASEGGVAPPIAGVDVCIPDVPSIACVQTDAAGQYALSGVPANTEMTPTFAKNGYVGIMYAAKTPDKDFTFNTTMVSNTLATALAGAAGVDFPLNGKALVSFFASAPKPDGGNANLDGVSATIDPPAQFGPIYFGPSQLPDKTLQATSSAGLGFFSGVTPGPVKLTFSHPSLTCDQPDLALQSSSPSSVEGEVLPNFQLSLSVRCH